MELGLKGKVVAVTGGSEGIGRAAVQRFVAEGAKVAFCARRKEALDKLADEMRKPRPAAATRCSRSPPW